jgi:flagellar assembly protein FliH
MSNSAVQVMPLGLARRGVSAFRPMAHGQMPTPVAAPILETSVDPYDQGLQDGQDMAAAAFAAERANCAKLLASAEALQGEASEETAQLIAEAVCTLVEQIVASAPVDGAWLTAQAQKAAAVISDCDGARTLRLNPEDLALLDAAELPLPVMADADLPRGELRIGGSAGWIEHGRSVYLDALRAALSRGEAA